MCQISQHHANFSISMHQLKIGRCAKWTNNKHLNSSNGNVIYWWRCPLSVFSFGFVLTSLFGKFSADTIPVFHKFRHMFADLIYQNKTELKIRKLILFSRKLGIFLINTNVRSTSRAFNQTLWKPFRWYWPTLSASGGFSLDYLPLPLFLIVE